MDDIERIKDINDMCNLLREPTPESANGNHFITPRDINNFKTAFVVQVKELMNYEPLRPPEHHSKELNNFLVDFQKTVYSADLDLIEDVQEVLFKLNESEEAWDLCKTVLIPVYMDWYNNHSKE